MTILDNHTRLPTVEQRGAAVTAPAFYGPSYSALPSGADLESRAVTAWDRNVAALQEPEHRIAVIIGADRAPPSSRLARQLPISWEKAMATLPKPESRIDAAWEALGQLRPGSILESAVVGTFVKGIAALPDIMLRIQAAERGVKKAQPNSLLAQELAKQWKRDAELVTDVPQGVKGDRFMQVFGPLRPAQASTPQRL